MKSGTDLIILERAQQFTDGGYTTRFDDLHESGELARAACVYADAAAMQICGVPMQDITEEAISHWPFKDSTPQLKDPITNLARAGALIAAEIDRLLRLEENKNEGRA